MELITGALATFAILMFVLGCLPFRVPAKVAPLATTAVAYGVLTLDHYVPTLVAAAAVASLVALASRYIVHELPEPWSWDDFVGRLLDVRAALLKPRPRRRKPAQRGPVGNRMPKLGD